MTSTDSVEYSPNVIEQRSNGSDRPAFKYLNRYVVLHIASKWHDVGLELMEIEDEKELDVIKAEPSLKDDTERAKRMLNRWLEKKHDASWNDLIKAFKIPNIGLYTLAYEIEGKLFSKTGGLAQNKNEEVAMCINLTTDATQKLEEFIMNSSNSNQQQIYKIDTSQETKTGMSNKSQVLAVHSSRTLSPPPGGITNILDNISNNEQPKRMPLRSDSSVLSPADSAGTTSTDNTRNANDDCTNTKLSDSEISARVCNAVSEYYRGQFVDRWKCKTDSSTINSLAALLVERDGEMKVVVFTAGVSMKEKCSYSINNGSADECMWGHCDGHAVSLCYRFASFYLITEMHRCRKNPLMSILEIYQGGYELKEGIQLHFFSTSVPCGFMDNEDCCLLSWKIPFKGKPHCLQCSSIILIGAYLGIQGPLSHFFSKPVCISSIIIPKYKDMTAIKATKIQKCFENFDKLLNNTNKATDSDYRFCIPHVEMAECKSKKLFLECFKPAHKRNVSHSDTSQTIENQAEIAQAAGAVPDVEGNLGLHMMVFTLNHGIGTEDFRRKMTLQLKNATKNFSSDIKLLKLESLMKARQRLCAALNVGEALEGLKRNISKEMNERSTTHQTACEVIEQLKEIEPYKSITAEVNLQINKLKDSFCTITKRFENDSNIQAVISSLISLRKSTEKFETDSRLMIESLDSLNKNITELVVDELTGYRAYKETLDDLNHLLKKSSSQGSEPPELMGCDWSRSLGAIYNDLPKTTDDHGTVFQEPSLHGESSKIDQQQQPFHENESHSALDSTDQSTTQLQESQSEMEAEEVVQIGPTKLENRTFLNKKLHSIYTGDGDQQQQYNLNNATVIDKEPPVKEAQEESQPWTTQSKERVVQCSDLTGITGNYYSMHQGHSSSYSPLDYNQSQQGAKLVLGNVEGSIIEKFQSQNHVAVQEEDQHTSGDVFGRDLTKLLEAEGSAKPKFLMRCMKEIEQRGLKVVGIYRVFTSAPEKIQKLRYRIDQDLPVDFSDKDISIISEALKLFLEELPDPLIPFSLHNKFIEAEKSTPPHKSCKLKLCVEELPTANYQTLKELSDHLRKVMKYSSLNKMQSTNLAIIFGPIIMRNSEANVITNTSVQRKIMEAFLINYDAIFLLD